MRDADDVLERLRLRARIDQAEPGGARHRRERVRLAASRPAAIGVGLALLALLLVAVLPRVAAGGPGERPSAGAGLVLSAGSGAAASPADDVSARTSAGPPAGSPTAEQPLVVYVAGAVGTPGVVELPAGARVADAVAAAGGALPEADLSAVNLARPVADGEMVYLPLPGEDPPAAAAAGGGGGLAGAGAATAPGLIDVNTASVEALTALPGIGPVLAGRIVAYREANGQFQVLADLGEVSGIGPKILASLEGLVAFG
ncbi:MAG: ComEA family DNA-binding protein [Bifidobacteriaceae bacterium]|jgi:competence protein ComEA|nr:ComEA family DNA-binding protein [Bifidobacteriaceae bacterium]